MPIAVVTGANSGIGHAFAKLLIDEPISPPRAPSRLRLRNPQPRRHLSHVHHNLQIRPRPPPHRPPQHRGSHVSTPKDAIETVTPQTLEHTFAVNSYGPLLLTQALLPYLLLAKEPKVAVMSSRMGSIADNGSGGQYAYRGSNAAVNAVFKSLAVDLKGKGVAVVLLHPGIVKTNLTAGGEGLGSQAVEADEAAGDLWRVLQVKGMKESGRWWHRSGEELPW
ncbi:hypothetical protein PMIN06_010368 [Paraphaeosphaeria minitans]|uniref:Short-chain dehydrogenase/reductase family protein (Oxidoreductase) n=1 Tax=Paraphaeosphaeria minitans TaxID=565426 RepID=A0A9P6GPM7_9PLEO|nr:short-chain dehydrogenase/reductase family protein (oxidoreductase) [Paraphaeosphaeria minitans]